MGKAHALEAVVMRMETLGVGRRAGFDDSWVIRKLMQELFGSRQIVAGIMAGV
jgi:cystathionine beta-lyase family protein involved in aluminum resistance